MALDARTSFRGVSAAERGIHNRGCRVGKNLFTKRMRGDPRTTMRWSGSSSSAKAGRAGRPAADACGRPHSPESVIRYLEWVSAKRTGTMLANSGVIPAKAGIQYSAASPGLQDPCFRGDDTLRPFDSIRTKPDLVGASHTLHRRFAGVLADRIYCARYRSSSLA
jgi:hypothetical protein